MHKRCYYKSITQKSTKKNYLISKNLITKFILERLFESLTSFTQKKINFFLVLKNLKLNTTRIILRDKIEILIKRNIVSLRKYRKSSFFKEGIHTLLSCAIHKQSSKLLAQFIANQLKKLKRHNFFIRFIQNMLKSLKDNRFSKFKSIKIEIKGRLNRRPRGNHKIIQILNHAPVSTINSNIDYTEETAFTLNGTLGIKI